MHHRCTLPAPSQPPQPTCDKHQGGYPLVDNRLDAHVTSKQCVQATTISRTLQRHTQCSHPHQAEKQQCTLPTSFLSPTSPLSPEHPRSRQRQSKNNNWAHICNSAQSRPHRLCLKSYRADHTAKEHCVIDCTATAQCASTAQFALTALMIDQRVYKTANVWGRRHAHAHAMCQWHSQLAYVDGAA
jgi:hypothetical protein